MSNQLQVQSSSSVTTYTPQTSISSELTWKHRRQLPLAPGPRTTAATTEPLRKSILVESPTIQSSSSVTTYTPQTSISSESTQKHRRQLPLAPSPRATAATTVPLRKSILVESPTISKSNCPPPSLLTRHKCPSRQNWIRNTADNNHSPQAHVLPPQRQNR